MDYVRVKNWENFQHYRDRNPPWIKLYNSLLDDYDFARVPDVEKGQLLLIWLLASRCDNRIPADPVWIQNKIQTACEVNLEYFIQTGYLELCLDTDVRKIEAWASRYVSKDLRLKILNKYDNKCAKCGKSENLEIDHIIPISQGGDSSEGNLQILCRKCNRKKHNCKTDDRQNVASVYTEQRQRRVEQKEFFSLKPKKCHRTGCEKMGTIWDTDDTGLRYWMCDEHKKKEAKV